MRSLFDFRHTIFYGLITSPIKGLKTLGGECPWTIKPDRLSSSSVVVSAGAGHDISFEIALEKMLGCRILLLDPSPTGKKTWEKHKSDLASVDFVEAALSGSDGKLNLSDPLDAAEGSFRSAPESSSMDYEVPCRSLKSLLTERGFERIDLLKMDIEGAEYDVINSILRDHIPVGQICVEFHHGPGFSTKRSDTISAIMRLRKAGYKLVHRIHWDHTFIHKSIL